MRRLASFLLLFMLCCLGVFQPAAAWNPFATTCQNGAGSAVCTTQSSGDPITTTIANVTTIVAFVAGAAAVVLLIVGALRYITSNGEGGNVSSAKNTVMNALIGLVVIVLARTLIVFVVNKL